MCREVIDARNVTWLARCSIAARDACMNLGLDALVRAPGTAWPAVGCRAAAGRRPVRDTIVVSLAPDAPPAGSVLVSYIIDPFLLGPTSRCRAAHSLLGVVQIARTFVDLGYAVDVISWRTRTSSPARTMPSSWMCGITSNGSGRCSTRIA